MADEMQQDDNYETFEEQNGNAEVNANAEDSSENQQMLVDEDDDGEDDRKVFVGGLSWETTTKDLREYFEKFGEVTNCTLKTDLETRKSRGFGFVVFATTEAVDKVLAEKEHKLHGRTIDPKRANPRPVNKKVFVGRLDPAITEDEVKAYFETFGPVEKLELPFDKTKEQRRAFCFVEFKKLSAMKKCLEQTNHKIGTQEVEVKKATPPGGAAANVRGGPRGRGFGPAGRGGRGGRGGFPGYGYNQGYGYGGYGAYPGYDQGYGYGYGGDYGYGGGYGGYGGWNSGGYDQSYGYGYGGQSNYGKAQKRGAAHGGYHPYNR
ncbi:heterogeneous nuclear ribonucleoprotein D-like isoform X2 [Biomphalaria glabrata]|uniref:Heterogeneous nuclear ribonucleoprotein D-like isoform X2 n=1 Tax=Biomphalaria glabrata TaxID=6526 RepID=A0A9U8DWJ0_BIOGL|nr:heterogeneous nuclear ribonucleoprotein D-like isoform X2 [Biomphalaria glabrata]XP_013064145.2 heterogeneous nuclear ribonucleoprotein D-like isoform X2 [Biomphalaria glabrata]